MDGPINERPPFQFSLRSLFIVVTCYAVICGLAASAGPDGIFWLVLLSILAVLGLVHVATFYAISRLPRPDLWFVAAIGMLAVGVVVGFWCGTSFEYQVSDVRRQIGFPFPIMVFQLENGQWVDYVGGPLGTVLDVFVIATGAIVPVSIALLVRSLINVIDRPIRSDRPPGQG